MAVPSLNDTLNNLKTPASPPLTGAPTPAAVQPAPVAVAPVPTKPKLHMLDKNFGLAEYKFKRWSVELDETHTLEHALDPTFYANQVDKIMGHDKARGRGDIIEIRKIDSGLYAEAVIVEIGVGYAKVELIRKAEPTVPEIAPNSPLTAKWNPGRKEFDVIRKSDAQMMKQGFQTKAAAAIWIDQHIKAMTA